MSSRVFLYELLRELLVDAISKRLKLALVVRGV